MNDSQPTKEFRPKRGAQILDYIHRFSTTEKVVFGVFVAAAIVSVLLMLNSISDRFTVEIPGKGGEIHEAVIGLPRNINPVLAVTDVDRDISALVYSGLMKFSGDKIVPDVAESYEVSKDGLVYTFTLKPDVLFHDGVPLTAEDVAFTIQKIQDPALNSPRRADWTNVTVSVIDASKVQFSLKQPYSPFPVNTVIGIIPKHIWNAVNNEQFVFSQYNLEPIGSGPYEKRSISRDSSGVPLEYHLMAWDKYYGKAPHIEEVSFHFFSDIDKALLALKDGIVNSIASVSPNEAQDLSEKYGDKFAIDSVPLSRIFGVFFNQDQNAVLADKSVRQALNMTADREAMVDKIFRGYGVSIDGPLPQISGGGSGATASNASSGSFGNKTDTPEALDDARQLLEKNGWKKNTSTGIYEKQGAKNTVRRLAFTVYTADTEDLKMAAEMLRNSWNELGADVTVKVFDSSDLYQNIIRPRKYDALLFGELIGRDMDAFAFWHSSQRTARGLNIAMYANSKVDKLLEEIREISDNDVQASKYLALDQLIRTDIPAVFLYSPNFIYVVPNELKGLSLGTLTNASDRWNSVSDWYLRTQRVWKIFADN